jgi:hypothetical protein
MISSPFKIIQVNTGDIERLSVFLAANAGERTELEWKQILQWMWQHNPSVTKETQLGWALENDSGKIGGFIGNVPVQYKIQGNTQNAIWGTSWYVDEKAKDLSLKMYIPFTRQKEMIFSNTQTPRVEVIMKKLGFTEMPVHWFKGAFVFPLSIFHAGFFRNMGEGLSIKKTGLAFLAMALKIPQAFVFLFYKRKNFATEITLEKIDTFPVELNNWFEAFSKRQETTFLRDTKNYEWLFCHNSTGHQFIKYQVIYQNKLQGFLIFKKRSVKNIPYIEIIDEALLPLSLKIQKRIILKAMFSLYKENSAAAFLILRSNMRNSTRFFRLLGGVGFNRGEKGYIKSTFVKPVAEHSTITSIDGDNLFF